MKRVCIIGNSHGACWLAAWRKYREEIASVGMPRFFLLGGYEAGRLEPREGVLAAPEKGLEERLSLTSEGASFVDPSAYDHFVIVSLTFGYRNLTPLFADYGLAGAAWRKPGLTYLSRPCLETAARGILANSLAVQLRNRIRCLTDAPVTLAPAPCRSEDALLADDHQFADLCRDGRQAYLYDLFLEQARSLGEEYGFSLAHQDPSTLIPGGCYTRREWSRQGINSSMAITADSDVSHMNIEFGRNALLRTLRLIDAGSHASSDRAGSTPDRPPAKADRQRA